MRVQDKTKEKQQNKEKLISTTVHRISLNLHTLFAVEAHPVEG
jgi:hypothetical protein